MTDARLLWGWCVVNAALFWLAVAVWGIERAWRWLRAR